MTSMVKAHSSHLRSVKDLLWPRPGERLIPAFSGLLLAASFPPLHLPVLPFIGLVPFALWIQGLSADAEGRRAAVRGSLVLERSILGSSFTGS